MPWRGKSEIPRMISFHWSARCMIASTEETKNPHVYRIFIGISAGFGESAGSGGRSERL